MDTVLRIFFRDFVCSAFVGVLTNGHLKDVCGDTKMSIKFHSRLHTNSRGPKKNPKFSGLNDSLTGFLLPNH